MFMVLCLITADLRCGKNTAALYATATSVLRETPCVTTRLKQRLHKPMHFNFLSFLLLHIIKPFDIILTRANFIKTYKTNLPRNQVKEPPIAPIQIPSNLTEIRILSPNILNKHYSDTYNLVVCVLLCIAPLLSK